MWQASDFSQGTLVSSTNKADTHDIAELLLKVALNTIAQYVQTKAPNLIWYKQALWEGGSVGVSWISERPHLLSHICFYLDFSVFLSIFSLFRKNNYVKLTSSSELCLSLLCIKDMLCRHSAAKEIKHSWKYTSGFIGPQILKFERSLSLSPGLTSSLVRLGKYLLEAWIQIIYFYFVLQDTHSIFLKDDIYFQINYVSVQYSKILG